MRTRTILLTLGLVLLLVAGAVAALAQPDGRRGQVRFNLYAVEDSFTWITADGTVDPGEDTPPGPGDRFVTVDTLYSDEARQDEVGRNDVECTFTSASGETEEDFEAQLLCHGVVTLDGAGTLAWQGATDDFADTAGEGPFIRVGLTGGTGQFRAAGGQVNVFDTSEGEEASARYEIRLLTLRRR
jgi:hypothetical protein